MKKILVLFLICFAQNTFSQIKTEDNLNKSHSQEIVNENNSIHALQGLDVKPEFPGGFEGFQRFIKENYKIPEVTGLKGKVYMTFIVEKDGSLSDIKTIRDLKHGTGDEAIRVLKVSPKWTSGQQNGKPVRALYPLAIPINQ